VCERESLCAIACVRVYLRGFELNDDQPVRVCVRKKSCVCVIEMYGERQREHICGFVCKK